MHSSDISRWDSQIEYFALENWDICIILSGQEDITAVILSRLFNLLTNIEW